MWLSPIIKGNPFWSILSVKWLSLSFRRVQVCSCCVLSRWWHPIGPWFWLYLRASSCVVPDAQQPFFSRVVTYCWTRVLQSLVWCSSLSIVLGFRQISCCYACKFSHRLRNLAAQVWQLLKWSSDTMLVRTMHCKWEAKHNIFEGPWQIDLAHAHISFFSPPNL